MMLNISNLSVSYGSADIINNLNFSLRPGSFTALLGPNGTGKSTLLKAMAKLVPSSGTVHFIDDVKPPADSDPLYCKDESAKSKVCAYMPQDTGVSSSLTVLEVVLLGRITSLGLAVPGSVLNEASQYLHRFGLADFESRTLNTLSGGQRQLVYLAQSLFRNPSVLLLDEPTSALDLRHQLIVLDHIADYCKHSDGTAVAAMHDLSLAAKYADRIICLSEGSIIADGTPVKVLTQALIRNVYRVEADVCTSANGILHITALSAC